jgi:hypothetical protein
MHPPVFLDLLHDAARNLGGPLRHRHRRLRHGARLVDGGVRHVAGFAGGPLHDVRPAFRRSGDKKNKVSVGTVQYRIGVLWIRILVDPDHFGNLDPHPDPHQIKNPDLDQIKTRIRIRIKVINWIRVSINLQKTSQNVWNMNLFEIFFKGLRLYFEARIWIRIRIRVKSRIRVRIRIK